MKQRKINIDTVPFQVMDIINKATDKKETHFVRENYLNRLRDIRDLIDATLTKSSEISPEEHKKQEHAKMWRQGLNDFK